MNTDFEIFLKVFFIVSFFIGIILLGKYLYCKWENKRATTFYDKKEHKKRHKSK